MLFSAYIVCFVKDRDQSQLYITIPLVPRNTLTPSQLQKPKAASAVQRQCAGLCYPSSPVQTRQKQRRIFQVKKILSTPSFGREVKSFTPSRRFTACKRSLNVTWKSGIFTQNSSAISRPSSSSFHYQGLWWRHLAVQVGPGFVQ